MYLHIIENCATKKALLISNNLQFYCEALAEKKIESFTIMAVLVDLLIMNIYINLCTNHNNKHLTMCILLFLATLYKLGHIVL